jgi:Protein of unknown function (DUF3558)
MSLSLDGVRPCDLLTTAQVKPLQVMAGDAGINHDGQGSPDCQWASSAGISDGPDNDWLVRLEQHDASYYLGPGNPDAQIVQIAGFPAVQSKTSFGDPNTSCALAVDVASGQNMTVIYSNDFRDYPGINFQVACQQATKVAVLLVGNLRRLVGK